MEYQNVANFLHDQAFTPWEFYLILVKLKTVLNSFKLNCLNLALNENLWLVSWKNYKQCK